jgi:hypothetical protein
MTNAGNNPFVDPKGETEISVEQMLGALLRYEMISGTPNYNDSIMLLSRYIKDDCKDPDLWRALMVLCQRIVFDISFEFNRFVYEVRDDLAKFWLEWNDHANPWRQGWIEFIFEFGSGKARARWVASGSSQKGMAHIITGFESEQKWADSLNTTA